MTHLESPEKGVHSLRLGPVPTAGCIPALRKFGLTSPVWGAHALALENAPRAITRRLSAAVEHLRNQTRKQVSEGCLRMRQRSGITPLLGLPGNAFLVSCEVPETLDATKIRRLPHASKHERRAEKAFVKLLCEHTRAIVTAYESVVGDSRIYSPDNAKRCFPAWGEQTAAKTPRERVVRARFNAALHTAATVIARLTFMQRLDVIAQLPADDPQRRILITAGPCAAGKSTILTAFTVSGELQRYGAIYDTAGEAECTELAPLLRACMRRGIPIDIVAVSRDVGAAAKRVIERGRTCGRLVDLVAFARSHTNGVDNFRTFVANRATQKAIAKGMCAIKIYTHPVSGVVVPVDAQTLPEPAVSTVQALEIALTELAHAARDGVDKRIVLGALAGVARVWPRYDHWFGEIKREKSAA